MASMIPYDRYARALSSWPFGAFDDFFAPLATTDGDLAFKMNVEDAGDSYVVTAELPGVKKDEVDVELNEGQMLEDVKIAINGAKPIDFFGHLGSQMPTTEEIVAKIISMKEGK